MTRIKLILASLIFSLSVAPSRAIVMTGEGIETPHGYITWESFAKFPQKIDILDKMLQETISSFTFQVRTLQAGLILVTAALIYSKLHQSKTAHNDEIKSVTEADATE